ncbi:MAG: acyltransferase, partial [Psychrobacillus psychrotolerans]|uniref:acyltransferase n=1 Tax=Psychrobacillus psychrotolerans TaxID=126156 RepID=UPI003BAF7CCB
MKFATVGTNVFISEKASIYNSGNIRLGNNVRIDDFCIVSAGEDGIEIGNNVHIACYVSLIGKSKIKLGNYVGVSSKTAIYSSSDDYSGDFLTGPTVDDKFRNIDNRPVILEDHVIIGAQCVV